MNGIIQDLEKNSKDIFCKKITKKFKNSIANIKNIWYT